MPARVAGVREFRLRLCIRRSGPFPGVDFQAAWSDCHGASANSKRHAHARAVGAASGFEQIGDASSWFVARDWADRIGEEYDAGKPDQLPQRKRGSPHHYD